MSAEVDNPEHPTHEYFRTHNATIVRILARLVTEQQKQGATHPDLDPVMVARQLLAVWSGLQSMWLVDPTFDLTGELQDAFRRLTGQHAMEARQALSALDQI